MRPEVLAELVKSLLTVPSSAAIACRLCIALPPLAALAWVHEYNIGTCLRPKAQSLTSPTAMPASPATGPTSDV